MGTVALTDEKQATAEELAEARALVSRASTERRSTDSSVQGGGNGEG